MSSFKDPVADSRTSKAGRARPGRVRPPHDTGAEAARLRELVDARSKVTVILKTGEQLRGRIRYIDRDCFSLRLAEGGLKLLLRKSNVLGIQEDGP